VDQRQHKMGRTGWTLVLILTYAVATLFAPRTALAARAAPGLGLLSLLDVATLSGFLTFISLVPLKKLVLGVACTATGALMPTFARNDTTGALSIHAPSISLSLKGAPRFGLIILGIVIALSSFYDAGSDFIARPR
jgi:hypothetical protein